MTAPCLPDRPEHRLVVGRDLAHRPGDPRDWHLRLPEGCRLEAPGGDRSLTASVLWAALRQGNRPIRVWDAGGRPHDGSPALLLARRLGRKLLTLHPGAADRAWARILALRLPPAGRCDGPVVMVLPSLVGNGAERQTLMLMTGLRARGWPVRVLVKHLHDRPGAAILLPHVTALGIPVQIWGEPPPSPLPALTRLERATAGLPDALAADLLALTGWMAVLKPRAVHGWLDGTAILAGMAAALLGVPRGVVGLRNMAPDRLEHGGEDGGSHPLARPLRPGLWRLARHPAITITANSLAVAKDHARWAGITPPQVIPNGVRMPPPGASSPQAQPPQTRPPQTLLVLGIFRLVPQKRPLLWVTVAARIHRHRPEVRFRLLGDGPLTEAVAARAKALGLPLEQPGRVDPVAPHLAEATVLLHVSAVEGLPNAVLEALAAGVPVVATQAGGIADLLPHPPTEETPTEETLATRVLALLDDPARRAALSAAGRNRIRPLSPHALVARHERLYDTPPTPVDESRSRALRARLRPKGLVRSLRTLTVLALAGDLREIGRRVRNLASRDETPPVETPAETPNWRSVGITRRPGGQGPLRLAWVGETLARDGAPLSLREVIDDLTTTGTITPAVGVALRDGPLRPAWTQAGWPVHVLPGPPPITPHAIERLRETVAEALQTARADRVMVNGLRAWVGVEAAAHLGVPCLWVIREPGPDALADRSRSVQARALQAFGLADRVVFVSRATAAAWAPWVRRERWTVIPNALPPLTAPLPDRIPARAALGWPPQAWGVLAVGTLCPRKDPLTLLAALPLLPDRLQASLRVVWVGRDDGDGTRARMEHARRRLPAPLSAAITVLTERDDLSPLWAAADAAVNVSRAEAAPRVVLEARRAGLPLVTTAVGGIAEQAAHWPPCWLVPPADPPALARALTAAWNSDLRPAPPGDDSHRFQALVAAYGGSLRALGGPT